MTSLAVFVAVDSRGPSALYFATDSRISLPEGKWDFGQKTFASTNYPDIFAFCGDLVLPAVVVPQAIRLIDAGCVVGGAGDFDHRFKAFAQAINVASRTHPNLQNNTLIMHGGRDGAGMDAVFQLGILSKAVGQRRWSSRSGPITAEHSRLVEVDGSGRPDVERAMQLWNESSSLETSRAAFSAFAEAVTAGLDVNTGGPPQLVGVYRISPARQFGIIVQRKRYIAGVPAHSPDNIKLEWRNELFERVDGVTKKRIPTAKKHVPR